MLISKTIAEIRSQLEDYANNKKVVLVPTMGALHEGHLALVRKAKMVGDVVVVSIFVNKSQFNDPRDYEKYPRQFDEDLEKLKSIGVNYVFMPENDEMLPENLSINVIPKKLADCLCGSSRPGHFDGVALIVSKLFNIIKPDIAIFGEKDFQQLAIIRNLVQDLNFDIQIISQDIIREKSGLAMSSRNQKLSDSSQEKAADISKTLIEIKETLAKDPSLNIDDFLEKKRSDILNQGFERIDYFEIRKEENLELVSKFDKGFNCRIFIAVYLEKVRLIDNMRL